MRAGFKPMLGVANNDFATMRYPRIASPKLDGWRCHVHDDLVGMSKSNKPLRNKHTQALIAARPWLAGMDGELIVGKEYGPGVINRTTSGVSAIEGTPDVRFFLFDCFIDQTEGFNVRLKRLPRRQAKKDKFVVIIEHKLINTPEEMEQYEAWCIENGYEGAMSAPFDAPYINKRSTVKEDILTKHKRYKDGEAKIIGCEEMEHNDNEATTNELGRTKRSSAKAGKRKAGILGAFVCERDGQVFTVGGGIELHDRAQFWANYTGQPTEYTKIVVGQAKTITVKPNGPSPVGEWCKYKSMTYGEKDAPRQPSFICLRDPIDM